jgi:hypothetical protein
VLEQGGGDEVEFVAVSLDELLGQLVPLVDQPPNLGVDLLGGLLAVSLVLRNLLAEKHVLLAVAVDVEAGWAGLC